MKLNFLGCGSAFNPLDGNTSAYFTIGRKLYIVDVGESVFLKLYEKDLLRQYDEILILITHLHADHVGSLPSLISYVYYVLGKTVMVMHPDPGLWQLLDLMGIDRTAYHRLECHALEDGKLNINAVPVRHADDMRCYGYVIECDGESIYYSGDSYEIPESILQKFRNREINRIYQDTAEFSSGHRSHCPLEELERDIPEDLKKYVYCMHFTTDFTEKLKTMGFCQVMQPVKT